MDNSKKIDFVILWVDGTDEQWLVEKRKYDKDCLYKTANTSTRFRDWDNLKFWFRCVERNANWVNKIYFVTYGHIPNWLKIDNPKLEIVCHKDFIPKEYLPTFNSNVILLNLHKIKGLSDKFVIFNDDMFIINKVNPEDFFKNDLPCDEFVFDVIETIGENDVFGHMLLNNIDIINKYFNKKDIINLYKNKIFNLKYGKQLIKSIFLICWKHITGIQNTHIAHSYLKKNFIKMEKLESEIFKKTFSNKFRTKDDITEWVIRYWQLCNGEFYPRKHSFGKYYNLSKDNSKITDCIEKRKSKILCINDVSEEIDFEYCKEEINNVFQKYYPNKSKYER